LPFGKRGSDTAVTTRDRILTRRHSDRLFEQTMEMESTHASLLGKHGKLWCLFAVLNEPTGAGNAISFIC